MVEIYNTGCVQQSHAWVTTRYGTLRNLEPFSRSDARPGCVQSQTALRIWQNRRVGITRAVRRTHPFYSNSHCGCFSRREGRTSVIDG